MQVLNQPPKLIKEPTGKKKKNCAYATWASHFYRSWSQSAREYGADLLACSDTDKQARCGGEECRWATEEVANRWGRGLLIPLLDQSNLCFFARCEEPSTAAIQNFAPSLGLNIILTSLNAGSRTRQQIRYKLQALCHECCPSQAQNTYSYYTGSLAR